MRRSQMSEKNKLDFDDETNDKINDIVFKNDSDNNEKTEIDNIKNPLSEKERIDRFRLMEKSFLESMPDVNELRKKYGTHNGIREGKDPANIYADTLNIVTSTGDTIIFNFKKYKDEKRQEYLKSIGLIKNENAIKKDNLKKTIKFDDDDDEDSK